MEKIKPSKFVLRFLGTILVIEIVIFTIIVLIGWRSGWQGLEPYAEALQIAGLLTIGIGFFGVKGNWDVTRSFGYQYSMSASRQSNWQRRLPIPSCPDSSPTRTTARPTRP